MSMLASLYYALDHNISHNPTYINNKTETRLIDHTEIRFSTLLCIHYYGIHWHSFGKSNQ